MGLFNKKTITEQATKARLLVLEIPKNNDKNELAAEQLFASLHGILRDSHELAENHGWQEHLSFEIASVGRTIRFYIWAPENLATFVEGQVYAQYPTVQIHTSEEDYTETKTVHESVATAELLLNDKQFLPIRTFTAFEVDPLAGITAALSKLDNENEEIWIQILVRPISDNWHTGAANYVNTIKNGDGPGIIGTITNVVSMLSAPPEAAEKKELSERDKTRVSEIETKSTKLGYDVKIRIAALSNNMPSARMAINSVASSFKQFNSTNLNGFKNGPISYDKLALVDFQERRFPMKSGFILNTEELASVYHLPHTNVETPNVVWANSKVAEPPANLPVLNGNEEHDNQISAFGLTNFRGMEQQFGILRSDRGRHIYIIGQTGTGKSGLLELLAISDIYHNQGYAIVDPHGDFAVNNLRMIPAYRLKDVVYFNPADTEYPMGFNPMEVTDPSMRNNTCSEMIGVMKRMFGDSWGPRLEHILRYTILALLEVEGSTMLDITRMLTDKTFRNKILSQVTDTVVLQFWRVEFANWPDKQQTESTAPVLNKVGAFTANPTIRNIIGQKHSSFNIREIMDSGKILIVNLSRGLIGEDNAAILGSFLITKIQLAAMSRSDIARAEDRRPFYLYVDEFQNFATDSFATILSEARKYGLCLTVANQYISQMIDTVRDAVFGNVGTLISMRISADDASSSSVAKQFEPIFEPGDIINMKNRHFVMNTIINGEKSQPFSGQTLALPVVQTDYIDEITRNTRLNYAKPVAVIQAEIDEAGTTEIPLELKSKTQRRAIRKNMRESGELPPAENTDLSRVLSAVQSKKEIQKTISPSGDGKPKKLGDAFKNIKPSDLKIIEEKPAKKKRPRHKKKLTQKSAPVIEQKSLERKISVPER